VVDIYDMDFFRKVNNAHRSESRKESTLYEIRESIAHNYTETIDFQPNTYVDGEHMPLIVMEWRGNSDEKERYKKIEAPPESTFDLGSKVDCFGMKWLVTEINYNQEVKLAGRMQLCNYPLTWQDDDGSIVIEDCVCSRYRTTATGEDIRKPSSKTLVVDETRRNILIQFNERTARLRQGKRFFIDLEGMGNPKVYRLTDLNRTSYIYNGKGCFELVCSETQINPDVDRVDLMLCDYRPVGEPLPEPTGSCEIRFEGQPVLKAGGSVKEFQFSISDVDSAIAEWELMLPPELSEDFFELSEISDDTVSLKAFGGIGHSVRLMAKFEDGNGFLYGAMVDISIVPLF